MIRGKNGFWLLVVIFSLITMMVVMNGENYGVEIVREKDGTMGMLMKKQHAAGLTISDLFSTKWSHQSQSMSGDHSSSPVIKYIDLAGSSIILMTFPFIVGASVLMIILWM